MTITLTPDIEAAVAEQARRQGTTPETLALESLREKFIAQSDGSAFPLREPQDDWEKSLRSAASPAGVSLTNEQLSREIMYADHD